MGSGGVIISGVRRRVVESWWFGVDRVGGCGGAGVFEFVVF